MDVTMSNSGKCTVLILWVFLAPFSSMLADEVLFFDDFKEGIG